ncbi:unnamed protein product [Caenorhabditis bovis]|uniref:Cystatin domain-containing protein n=1 Tax=Caenorhabditis bovis TaxID=2654633 RepID=A0A8S1EJJ7_9PELO|nr:unnamed protein product [Caenorhabditis bovis]
MIFRVVAVFLLISFVLTAPVPANQNDEFLGLAWEAAATSINVGNPGKFWVPIEIVRGFKSGAVTTLTVILQESWCSPQEGNDLDDVCESMCPVYYGGAKATYEVIATENNGGSDFRTRRIA